MRKQTVAAEPKRGADEPVEWLDLERLARVELTSEDADFPIEAALGTKRGAGWRAAAAGEQLLRFVFDEPQRLERIQLIFEEEDTTRTQEFALRYAHDGDEPAREIVRQQWNFDPSGSTREVEEYRVDLTGVKVLELALVPDIGGGPVRASLRSLRVA